MGIGVKHTVEEELLAVGVVDELRHGLQVYAGGPKGVDIGDLDAFKELHDQDAAGGVLPVDVRDDDVGAGGEVLRYELRVMPFIDEVQL